MELAAGEHGAAPHRTKILGRLHGPATRDPVEASAARTLRPHVAGSCTRTSADPRPALPGPGRASAARTLPRPSDSDRVRLARERTTPPARTNGPQAILLVKILGPPRTCHSQAPVGTRAARTLPRPSDSDRVRLARSQPRHRAAPHEPGRTRPTRSNAIPRESGIRLNPPPEILSRPRPATARPGGTRAARTLPRAGAPD